MLHTTTGFLCAATGFALIDILNRNSRIKFQLSPVYVALAAFCFSMTVGVLWEFFEFGMDRVFHMDMQKDTIVHSVTSVMLDPTNSNIPVTIDDITSVAVNGRDLGFDGYLDIGLYDTMADLFVNFIGAWCSAPSDTFMSSTGAGERSPGPLSPPSPGRLLRRRNPRKRRMLPGNKPHSKVGGAELPPSTKPPPQQRKGFCHYIALNTHHLALTAWSPWESPWGCAWYA